MSVNYSNNWSSWHFLYFRQMTSRKTVKTRGSYPRTKKRMLKKDEVKL